MKDTVSEYGFCHVTIEPPEAKKLLRSNNERAFVIAQLQDLLSPRLILGDVPAYRQLSSCIDLLAFSISHEAIHLLIFTIDTTLASDFAHRITARLVQFQYEFRPRRYQHGPEARVHIEKLIGPHQALARSIQIHLLHQDWEYDRYSSIGFYLHDRRGDWMRLWRLTALYDNDPTLYYGLIEQSIPPEPESFVATTPLQLPAS